jgi:hypothetical protein
MPKNPTADLRYQIARNRVPVGRVVPLPKVGAIAVAAGLLTPAHQANVAKIRAQVRASLPGLGRG